MADFEDDDQMLQHAIVELAAVFNVKEQAIHPSADFHEAIWLAFQYLGSDLGIELIKPTHLFNLLTHEDVVKAIAQESQIRFRKIILAGEWWKKDNGPILAFDNKSRWPCALIRSGLGYRIINPSTGESKPLNSKNMKTLAVEGYMLYRRLPAQALNLKNLFHFIFKDQKKELSRILFLQLSIGLFALFVPVATGILLNRVIPNAEVDMLREWILALIVFALSSSFFFAVQTISFLRFRIKTNTYAQAAVWDRLLRLPLSFFRKFSPGDLAQRAQGLDTIQQLLTDASIQAILGGLFSIFPLALMFYYSVWLAISILGLQLIVISIIILSSYIQLHYQRPIANLQGRIAALTLQFLTSIGKLRVSHSEIKAFDLWALLFAKKSKLAYKSYLWQMYLSNLIILFMLLGIAIIFGLVGSGVVPITFGYFIAFNAAYGQFLAAILAFVNVFVVFIQTIPQYERIEPILQTIPEEKETGIKLLPLIGKISLKNISFHYEEEASILNNFSLEIEAGEMIAFFGPTGCGKSTLIRLLLGFETPISGEILYDQHNLTSLNLRVLREQLGVVLQNTTLFPGSIYENIKGAKHISLEEAWEAAELAHIADDIKAMPMNMLTLVSEWGRTLSVGQRQRLMIARALASKPRLLILDEATSALDNPTQIKIMNNIEKLPITRIIIAHRAKTLENIQRIFVMQKGEIIESGNFQTLLSANDFFKKLTKYQM